MNPLLKCMRPTLHFRPPQPQTTAAAASYVRFYSVAQGLATAEVDIDATTKSTPSSNELRTEAFRRSSQESHPRFSPDTASKIWTCRTFSNRFDSLAKDETSKVFFTALNGTLGGGNVGAPAHVGRKGMKGHPHRTARGQLSILVTQMPELLSPCLHEMPTDLQDPETRIRNRHVDFQVNRRSAQLLRFRSKIIARIRDYLEGKGYLEVQTPILANLAGGAVARPFQTHAVEFLDRHIELRTAPELWLKRLVLGGFEKIFEIGPCFRNEGIDKIHNPEFTTCEFYDAYVNLDKLMTTTERFISELITYTNQLTLKQLTTLSACDISIKTPFQRLDFIKNLESVMQIEFPDLKSPKAEAFITQIFKERGIRLPESATLPRLLDRLASKYLEPLCQDPTWIIHHPECLSPLSKSFVHPDTSQRVSARAELFIKGKEVVNTYEEENSPFEQRRKFEEQIKYRNEDNRAHIDENYLEALEWGLPPTGGWGCGVDRLVMLLSGTDRINDVLPFGNLRNVVSLGRGGRDAVSA
ncbi:MAG: hypothetical protein Q9209_001207 [Squamulea sp. 1 TL-2023]